MPTKKLEIKLFERLKYYIKVLVIWFKLVQIISDGKTNVTREISKYIGRRYMDWGDMGLVVQTVSDLYFPVLDARIKGSQNTNTLILDIDIKSCI